jgi:hypothetical protein
VWGRGEFRKKLEDFDWEAAKASDGTFLMQLV